MTPEAERTRAAMSDLAEVLQSSADDLQRLSERARGLKAEFTEGRVLRELVAAEPKPLVVAQVSALLDRIASAGAALRRAEAQQLRAEGLTQQEVADLFGVTRQRVAALLEPVREAG